MHGLPRYLLNALVCINLSLVTFAQSSNPQVALPQERDAWFARGRYLPGQTAASLRLRAHRQKTQMRGGGIAQAAYSGPSWAPLGPAPLASDASGTGLQDYGWISGRATAVAADPADSSGNTVYLGGAYGGLWKSTNAGSLSSDPSTVTWMPLTDNQPTLAIGSIAVQPGNTDPAKSVILAGTGETNNSGDSYYGLGILRSSDGGSTWNLIADSDNGARSFAGLGFSKISFSTASPNTVVAGTSFTAKGLYFGYESPIKTNRGIYYSNDAGLSWRYASVADASTVILPSPATSVAYNAGANKFYAAVQYHGFYSSADGANWSRLPLQPGAGLATANCPANFTSLNCLLYRGEIAVVPGRNEMYVWYVDSNGNDQGIWRTLDGGASWSSISNAGITNCGDVYGCSTAQGFYDLALAAVPNNTITDLYAGAVNVYKCTITGPSPSCSGSGANQFINLTHVYGCAPNFGSIAHVYPNQHAMDFSVANGKSLLYFANDGGIYRALDGYTGLTTGTCGGTNQFDSLNQTMGSLTQLVSLSQDPSDLNILLAGAAQNGVAATNSGQNGSLWLNLTSGNGGYGAIAKNSPTEWFIENTGLSIQHCTLGSACRAQDFRNGLIVTSANLAGDAGPFYTPFILDPQPNTSELIIGTCRVWRGSGSGGSFTALSDSFENGAGGCTGMEINMVRALAAGGPPDSNGFSNVIYAGTDGYGAVSNGAMGGHVWNTTNALGGPSSWVDRTNSINPSAFPISSIAMDESDGRGYTAFVTIMGFQAAHVWKTVNAGTTWTDFTGTAPSSLPDAPADALAIDSQNGIIYAATDVGVFSSPTSMPVWSEVGPNNGAGALPNVAVTALSIFNSAGVKRLRAATYGRGAWEIPLISGPDFELGIAVAEKNTFAGTTAGFDGTLTAYNGYNNSVSLSCIHGSTQPPVQCSAEPAVLLNASGSFSLKAGGAVGDYLFKLRGVGSDGNALTHDFPIALHVMDFSLGATSPSSIVAPRGLTSPPVAFQVSAQGPFNGVVSLQCSGLPAGASCSFSPSDSVTPITGAPVDATLRVLVPAGTTPGNSTVTITATVQGAPAAKTQAFLLNVTTNPDFILSLPVAFPSLKSGTRGSGSMAIAAQDGFSDAVSLSCSLSGGSCSLSPAAVTAFPATVTVTADASNLASRADFSINVTGTSGSKTHLLAVPLTVTDYQVTATTPQSASAGQTATSTLTFIPVNAYVGTVSASCDASSLSGASCSISSSGSITVGPGQPTATVSIAIPANAAGGTYSIVVNTQDTGGAPRHSTTIPLTVGGSSDFTVSSTTGTQTVKAGQSAQFAVTIGSSGSAYNGTVTLACSSLPSLSTCSFSPSSVAPGNSGAASTLVIGTTAAIGANRNERAIWYASFVPGFAVILLGNTRKRRGMLLLLLALISFFVWTACGGGTGMGAVPPAGGTQPGTPAGTYHITVTGSSGALVHSMQVTLTVQ